MTKPASDSPVSGFASLGLAPPIVAAVAALGYEEATPIQREAIPALLTGRDLIGQAGTGTGKTAAFALPMLHRLAAAPAASRGRTRGLVLVPTRELAMQVAEALHKYAKGLSLSVVPLYGGASMEQQIRALRRGASIAVATPGRALDHLRRQTLVLSELEILVLDEADEMLDMGFAEDLDAILEATPRSRQTALFAATMAPRILTVAARHLNDPARVNIAPQKPAAGKLPRIRQSAYLIPRAHKTAALDRVLEYEHPNSALVFCRTRLEVEELTDVLNAHGYSAQALHGGMEQRQRDRVMNMFRSGQADLLIATDVAARGIDIEHISHVINYDVPSAPEVYIHRIGRTGRAGREGVAITLVEPREHRFLRNIQGLTKQKIEVRTVPSAADVQLRRLEATREALRKTIEAGGLERMRDVVATLAQEFDVMEVAAAAVRLVHESGDEESEAVDIPETARPSSASPREGARNRERRPVHDKGRPAVREHDRTRERFRNRDEGGPAAAVLRLNVGRNVGVRPGDLVGAITGEARVDSEVIGAIKVADAYSLVEVASPVVTRVLKALRGATIRGQRVQVKTDR
jgi:ATP-dependent RNA helicase DeaD